MSPEEPQAGETWRQLVADLAEFARARLAGDYEIDEWGFDPDLNGHVLMPAARLLYRDWFQVQMAGLEHVPESGAGLVVANHSGVLPFDAIMLQTGVFDEHPSHRNLRLLGGDLVYAIPLLADLARKSGHTRADPANAHQLLCAGELVGTFPEGYNGIGKPFSQRYQLQRFGRGGFAATAMRAGAPIIPCAIVGAEEIYPMIGKSERAARLLRLPYFPVTPLFPWLGPIGAVPLPSKWIIEFCDPVLTDGFAADQHGDPEVISGLADKVKDTIQRKIDELLVRRGAAFG